MQTPDAGPTDSGIADSLFGPLPTNEEQFRKLVDAAQSAAESGQTLAQIRKIAPQDLDALYEQAVALCDQEKWSDAVLIALRLALHAPRDVRFLFLAGTCLQRRMEFQMAAGLYGLSLIEQEQPITLFRMAECLAASGEFEPAREAFDACHEMCRGDFELRDLQDACADALVKLTRH